MMEEVKKTEKAGVVRSPTILTTLFPELICLYYVVSGPLTLKPKKPLKPKKNLKPNNLNFKKTSFFPAPVHVFGMDEDTRF